MDNPLANELRGGFAGGQRNHARRHGPILKGFEPYESAGSLYKNPNIAKDVEVLLTGTIAEHTEPIAWTRTYKGGRVFYTSLGHPKDFAEARYLRLLTNAIFWTAKREVK